MAVTWPSSPPTGVVNAEGNLIVFDVTVTSDTESDLAHIDGDVFKGDKDLVGPIQTWRFDASDGTTWARNGLGTDDGRVSRVFAFNIGDLTGTGPYALTFKIGIELNDTGRMALHPAGVSPAPKILSLTTGWFRLYLSVSHDYPAPAWSDVPLDASKVGRLPTPASPHSGDFRLNTDAQAAWVASNGTPTGTLSPWNDISGTGNNLTAGSDPALDAPGDVPAVTFDGGTSPNSDRYTLSSPPVITTTGTIAAVFIPGEGTPSPSHILGRYNNGNRSWQAYYTTAGGDKQVVYQTRSGTTYTPLSLPTGVDIGGITLQYDSTVFVLLRRGFLDSVPVWKGWMNGRTFHDATTIASAVETGGSTDFSVGARITNAGAGTWGEACIADINQIALYTVELNDLEVSLVLHQMATRSQIDLGTPIKAEWRTQPYGSANESLPPERRLDRRPIAVIQLNNGRFSRNIFGQTDQWRVNTGIPSNDKAAIKASLRDSIRAAFVACDQFEIMFNRPGGKYREEIVPSHIFGTAPAGYFPNGGEDVVLDHQWEALSETWTEFNLADSNEDGPRTSRLRRGWFYTGGGLPLNDDGTLNTNAQMGNRVVAPATPEVYYQTILEEWTAKDSRFRCLFMDAAIKFFGKQVELVHSPLIFEEFTLVGEAIPQSDPEYFPVEASARLGAPWFGMGGTPRGPWWSPDANHRTSLKDGYNVHWTTDWNDRPVYIGVQAGGFVNLHYFDRDQPKTAADDLKLGDIYSWTRKGATPVAWSSETTRRVGAAFDYATGRLDVSRFSNSPRILRVARS